jgi:hypothetical protein
VSYAFVNAFSWCILANYMRVFAMIRTFLHKFGYTLGGCAYLVVVIVVVTMMFASIDFYYMSDIDGVYQAKNWTKTLVSFWWYWLGDMGNAVSSMETNFKYPLAQLFYFLLSVVISMLCVNVILAIMIELWESVH